MHSLALVGKNISHSRSQEMYEKLLGEQVNYTKIDVPRETELPSLVSLFEKNIGVSITSPYKGSYLPLVELDERAKGLSAINCIKQNDNKSFLATNTDYLALCDLFDESMEKFTRQPKIVLLGNGHMADLTANLLDQRGIKYVKLARNQGIDLVSYDFTQLQTNAPLFIINACSREFVFRGRLPKDSVFWDYNYDFFPHKDELSSRCEYWDGLRLLYLQAKYALKFWEIPTE